jgi:hypothetical protein
MPAVYPPSDVFGREDEELCTGWVPLYGDEGCVSGVRGRFE